VISLRARLVAIAFRTTVAGVCALGIWYSWGLLRADNLGRLDTEESLRAAIRIEPDAWGFYMRLTQFDEAHAQQLLETAIKLNPYNADAHIELGLRLEAEGDYGQAEKLLLDAFAIDRTFTPRWSLANFYLRRENIPQFWVWARRAAEMPSDSTGSLFELCWRVSPDANDVANKILNSNPDLIHQYVDFLLTKDQLQGAAEAARRLVAFGAPETDKTETFSVIDRLLAANDGASAKNLWNALIEKHWVVADAGALNNPNFARDPLPVGFDWALSAYSGLHSWPGPSGLETEFTGEQPEDCTVAEQAVVLAPGNYTMEYSYRTDGIPPDTGLRWQIVSVGSGSPMVESSDLSNETLSYGKLTFSIPPEKQLVHLRLQYQRTLGTPRISGTVVIPSIVIHAQP
jgi:hypothetical protein